MQRNRTSSLQKLKNRKNKIIVILVAIQKRRHYVILEFTLCKEGYYNEVLSHNN